MTLLIATFAVEAEAERALTQLRAAGIPDARVSIAGHEETGLTRDYEVGVPDNAAGDEGLRGGEDEPPRPVRMTIDLAEPRVDRRDVVHMINAAGGVVED